MKTSTAAYYQPEALNILMVSVPPETRGPLPLLTQLLVSGLQQLGYKVRLATCWGHKDEKEGAFQKIVQRMADIRQIYREARRDQFALIYIHTSLDKRALLRDLPLAAVLRLQKAPVVMLFHGSHLETIEAHTRGPFSLGTRLLLKLVSGVLVFSTEEQKTFQRLWPWVKVGVVTQPMMLNPVEDAVPSAETRPEKMPTLLYAGRLIPEKGVQDVLEAFFRVSANLPCRLIIAGDGPLKDAIQKMAAGRPDLLERIEITGYLDRKAMWAVYRRSDVLLLPTYYAEGMPTVILEAMASGLGLICTPIRGAADHLQEGRNVFFVPPQQPDMLANRIIELLTTPQALSQMKKNNLKLSSSFDPKTTAYRQIEIIRSFGLLHCDEKEAEQ